MSRVEAVSKPSLGAPVQSPANSARRLLSSSESRFSAGALDDLVQVLPQARIEIRRRTILTTSKRRTLLVQTLPVGHQIRGAMPPVQLK